MADITPLRIGVLACHRYVHTRGIWGPIIQGTPPANATQPGTRATRMRLTHAWDVDPEGAQKFAAAFPGVEVVGGYADMLGKVDAVILDDFDSCPHFPQLARPYLEAGVPMFINRPLALCQADAEAIVGTAREHGAPLMSASSFEFAPEVSRVRQEVAALEQIHGYAAANSMSDYATHGIHGLWLAYACVGGGIRSVSYQTGDWHEPNGIVVIEHEGRNGGRPFYGSVEQIGGTWGWIRVFGTRSVEQTVQGGPYFWLPIVIEMQRMFESRVMPQTYDELLEKNRLFLAGFRSHVERGGAPVRLDEVGDWQAPRLNPDPYPAGFFG